jgi:type VI protein secretion system component VasK
MFCQKSQEGGKEKDETGYIKSWLSNEWRKRPGDFSTHTHQISLENDLHAQLNAHTNKPNDDSLLNSQIRLNYQSQGTVAGQPIITDRKVSVRHSTTVI